MQDEVLSQEQIESLDASLHGEAGGALLKMMQSLSLREPRESYLPAAVQCAKDAELLQPDENGRPRLTPLGWKVSDSIREYCFWEERDRIMNMYDERPVFADSMFRDKRVLEIGSGFGCNLFSLQPVASSVVGMEIEPVYVQMTPVLAKLAGIETPMVHVGQAEQLPMETASQDVVMAFGSMQFMEFETVLAEIVRVLDDGGVFIAIMSPISLFMKHELRDAIKAREIKRALRANLTLANTYYEQLTGRRMGWFERRNPMNRAVYPTRRRMKRLFLNAGLRPDDALTEDCMHERIYVARKTG